MISEFGPNLPPLAASRPRWWIPSSPTVPPAAFLCDGRPDFSVSGSVHIPNTDRSRVLTANGASILLHVAPFVQSKLERAVATYEVVNADVTLGATVKPVHRLGVKEQGATSCDIFV